MTGPAGKTTGTAAAVLLVLVAGCAAAPKSRSSEPAAPSQAAPQAETAPQAGPAPQAEAAPTTPAAPVEAESQHVPKKAEGSKDAPGTSHLQGAIGGDLERAQRELDVAGGNCTNACRALGSMDRAAGRLCHLARSNDERGRCTDASSKVRTARDKVKRSCGTCPDVTVERDAAIPSR